MSKTSIKVATFIVAAGLFATTVLFDNNVKADEVYSDTSVGISSALDKYVETSSQGGTTANVSLSEATEATTAADDTQQTSEAAAMPAVPSVETQSLYPQFEDRCLTTASDSVNIRAKADENSELIGTLASGGIALVKEVGTEWTKVASGTCEGYIKNDYLVYGDDAGEYAEDHLTKLATVTADTLKVRETADADGEVVTTIPNGSDYAILSTDGDWTKIEVDENTTGYVSSDYVDTTFQTVRAVSVEEAAAKKAAEEAEKKKAEEAAAAKKAAEAEKSSSKKNDSKGSSSKDTSSKGSSSKDTSSKGNGSSGSTSSSGSAVANYALQFVGNPYVWGGTSLTNGADCSGFVMSVYAHFGYSLPHSSRSQANCGTQVSLSELQPGDLLFYNNGGSIGHVAMYIGNGMIVHASSRKTGIKTSSYNYRTPCKAVRILK